MLLLLKYNIVISPIIHALSILDRAHTQIITTSIHILCGWMVGVHKIMTQKRTQMGSCNPNLGWQGTQTAGGVGTGGSICECSTVGYYYYYNSIFGEERKLCW